MSAAARLTPARRDALLLVAAGTVHRGPTQWFRAWHPGSLRSRPYEALWHAGLIELSRSQEIPSTKKASLSAAGAALVEDIKSRRKA